MLTPRTLARRPTKSPKTSPETLLQNAISALLKDFENQLVIAFQAEEKLANR